MDEFPVLIFNFPQELVSVRMGILSRPPFVVDAAGRAFDLFRRLETSTYRMAVLNMPGDGVEFKDVFPLLRGGKSRHARCILVLLTEEPRMEDHQPYLKKGLNALLPVTAPAEEIEAALARLTQVAPRIDTRVMVKLRARIEQGTSSSMCQTGNLSSSGMFLVTRMKLPVGATLTFELLLPGMKVPLSGEAKVMRHSATGREKSDGMGVMFTTLRGDGRQALLDFLSKLRPNPTP
jgi:hypothetical protein